MYVQKKKKNGSNEIFFGLNGSFPNILLYYMILLGPFFEKKNSETVICDMFWIFFMKEKKKGNYV